MQQQPSSRDRLLATIAEADSSGPTNPFLVGEDPDAEAGVHSDMMKLRNPEAWIGDVEDGDEPTLLPLDLNE